MKKTKVNCLLIVTVLVFFAWSCKKKDSTENPPEEQKQYALVIDNGAQSMEEGKSLTLSAHLVSSTGEIITPSGISWSSSSGVLAGNIFSSASPTVSTISASVDYEGKTYSSSVLVNVQPLKSTQVFAVVPSIIMWTTGAGDIPLTVVYMGNETVSFSFSSDNASIAGISSSGVVSFNNTGTTTLRVKAKIGGRDNEVIVPVMVVGLPSAPLPVTRITLSPAVGEMFRNETLQFTAKAYNSSNEDVTGNVSFSYSVVAKQEDDRDPAIPVTVDNTGKVSSLSIGSAYVQVRAAGFMAQSEVIVNPDTVIMVNPFYTMLGTDYSVVPPTVKSEETFTAITYKVDRQKYRNKDNTFLSQVINSPSLTWEIPTTGIPLIDDQFKVVNILSKTNQTAKVAAITGKVGSTFIVAHDAHNGGAAAIVVNP
jgi:hypothetical protein